MTPEDFLADLPGAIWAAESPALAFPLYVAARAARRYVKVLLSGEGADELFGGCWTVADPQQWFSSLAAKWAAYAPPALAGALLAEISRFFTPDLPLGEQVRRWDLGAQLANNSLWYCDHLAMAHGVEVRVPFLDEAVVERALRMDFRHLVNPPVTKLPLRRILKRLLADRGIAPAPTRQRQPFKLGLPSAFAGFYAVLDRWADRVIPDAALAAHPLRPLLGSKGELVALRVFGHLMLHQRGRPAPARTLLVCVTWAG